MRKGIITKKAIIFGILLLLTGSILIPFIASSEGGDIWWNDNWSYCRILHLNNPSDSYQIKILVGKNQGGDVNCNGHCKNDFSDIRFIDTDNTTQLSYWLEDYSDGNQATFWVKLPSDAQSDSKILIYYGNTAATSNSNGDTTFLWFDDFHTDPRGEWTKVEDFQDKGWIFYNTNYHSSMDSARLRSNVDCVNINAEAWDDIGEISQGLKGKNDDMLWTNSTVIGCSSRKDGLATETQPTSELATTNAQGTATDGYENVMSEGINGYVTELLYSYPNSYIGGKIWDSSNQLLWNAVVSSNIPDHLTYLFWYLKDLHNYNGYYGAGLFYDSISKKLIICCNSTDPNDPWLKLRYSWMFLADYTMPEPTISGVGDEIPQNQPPIADAGGPYYANVNNAVALDGSGSIDTDGTIEGYRWDFTNDGIYDTAWLTSPTTTHTYSSEGTYTIKLEVKDDDGATDTDTTTATITSEGGAIPTAEANGPYSGYVNHPVTFSSSGSNGGSEGTIVSWYWTFGDQTVSSQQNPKHTYTSSGIFTITLTVTNNYGQSDTDTSTATISDLSPDQSPPVANPGGPYSGIVGSPIAFNGSGSNDSDGVIVSYTWDFGDGTAATGETPTHIYSSAGNYTVVLTVTDNDTLTDSNTTNANINVSGPPTIVISIDISNIEPIEEENEKTLPVKVFCYHQPVSNIHLEILESSNLTVTFLSPNITLNPGESGELLIKIKAPQLEQKNKSGNNIGDETIILRAVGDQNITSNTEQINLKIIEKNATPGFETIATIAAVGSAGALVTFFRRRNRNR